MTNLTAPKFAKTLKPSKGAIQLQGKMEIRRAGRAAAKSAAWKVVGSGPTEVKFTVGSNFMMVPAYRLVRLDGKQERLVIPHRAVFKPNTAFLLKPEGDGFTWDFSTRVPNEYADGQTYKVCTVMHRERTEDAEETPWVRSIIHTRYAGNIKEQNSLYPKESEGWMNPYAIRPTDYFMAAYLLGVSIEGAFNKKQATEIFEEYRVAELVSRR